MIVEHLSAAALGALASALRYTKKGWVFFVQVLLSSACLAFFVGPEIVIWAQFYLGFKVSKGAVFFLTSYFATELLSKAHVMLQAIRVTKK